jgi:hypothetical protein
VRNTLPSKSVDQIEISTADTVFSRTTMRTDDLERQVVHKRLILAEIRTLSPGADVCVSLFALGNDDIWGEQDVLNKRQNFTLELRARDAPSRSITLEYDPSVRPPRIRRAS